MIFFHVAAIFCQMAANVTKTIAAVVVHEFDDEGAAEEGV